MADEPDWAKLLAHLYSNTGGLEVQRERIDEDWSRDTKEIHQLELLEEKLGEVAELDADQSEVKEILNKLERWNLVKVMSSDTEAVVSLEDLGFDVAHEREIAKRQDRTNRVLAVLTAGLVFAALVQALGTIVTASGTQQEHMALGTVIIAFAVAVVLWRFGSLPIP